VHWGRLEASALGSLIAACPACKKREEEFITMLFSRKHKNNDVITKVVLVAELL